MREHNEETEDPSQAVCDRGTGQADQPPSELPGEKKLRDVDPLQPKAGVLTHKHLMTLTLSLS